MSYILQVESNSLSDEELRFLSEYTPYAEGGLLSEFEEEGKRVMEALAQVNAEVTDKRARRLLLLRGFYFLGVLRGAEAYRNTILDTVNPDRQDAEPLAFEVDEGCAQLFADDLNRLPRRELEKLCSALGM